MDKPLIKQPHISVFQNDGGDVSVHISEKDKLVTAWMSGETFIKVVGMYGQDCYIKLREVNLINVWDIDALEVLNASSEAERHEEMLDG